MSDHDCGCGSKRIVVQCGSGCGSAPPPPPPPTTRYSCVNSQCVADPNGAYASFGACLEACRTVPPPPPPPSAFCSSTLVRIDSINVGESGAGPDPGANAEW